VTSRSTLAQLRSRACIWRTLGVFLIASAIASCGGTPALPASALHDVGSLDQFRAAFNADVNRPRLVVVLAPT
jgi:hypothetical protein